MKKIRILSPFCLMILFATAQQKTPIHFASISQVGLLIGNHGESASVQTINGLSNKYWFTGIGTGIDFYGQRTIPLFIDVRRQFFKSVNKPFIYADAGVHFQWLNFIQNENRGFPDAKPGLYYDAGIGYSISLKKRTAFLMSAGYNYKRVDEEIIVHRFPASIQIPAPDNVEHRISEYRRWVVKIGIRI